MGEKYLDMKVPQAAASDCKEHPVGNERRAVDITDRRGSASSMNLKRLVSISRLS